MSDGPSLGGRVRIYWPSEKRWFRGEVKLRRMKRGCAEHRVDYDDGDSRWHNYLISATAGTLITVRPWV